MENIKFRNGSCLSDFKNGLFDIGQLSKEDIKQLNRLVKNGKLIKGKKQRCPPLVKKVTCYEIAP